MLKFLGVGVMLAGLHPLLAYGLVGVGAAAYSPAKYGILRELVNAEKLVKANSLIEDSTIIAILLSAILGGWLADISVTGALIVISGSYIVAAVANLSFPLLTTSHRLPPLKPGFLSLDFFP